MPSQAAMIRDGEEVTIPSSEAHLNDTVLLRPGDKVPRNGASNYPCFGPWVIS